MMILTRYKDNAFSCFGEKNGAKKTGISKKRGQESEEVKKSSIFAEDYKPF